MFDDAAEDAWDDFERRLREAFDRRDGVDFEIVLMRMHDAVVPEIRFALAYGCGCGSIAP